ncbi:SUMF1/EgtB/PvdO family nonheme iron enzyme [Roseofilum casamattae]|uniref:SUMF1/EgtB/PvdO family nonheme iron enzyme n=1 Tax=Roseofilum casamattae BLCC-M143 TaxID=3022442 RepID=A0ABT7C141_9CYAN|nr:SUMF1/EgtB/PvdO family nonheme iron enzyme [Roseofilum casamattae]MDJ1185175.1 SUMF1/EgtB/PvdO family nonheme iron enzyme [Roseofilum casamattae BLCC-M143]
MPQVLAGHYVIERKLSQGGFGQTYLAKDLHLPGSPICVVKQLKPQSEDSQMLKIAQRLFNREAQTLQRLGEHPQIPRLLAFFEQDDEFYLVQEYIQGRELSREIHAGKQWSETDAIALLRDMLVPLEFVHQQGVIHRDLKPANIIRRSQDDKLVLIDFGAVKQTLSETTTSTERSTSLIPSVIIGSRGYMPSEQAIGRPKLSSDIYAIGIIAIQTLTGKAPKYLPKDTETEEILWQQFASVSPELRLVLEKMVRYHFGDRYSCASEALEAVRALPLSSPSAPAPRPKQPEIEPDTATAISTSISSDSVSIESSSSTAVTFRKLDREDRWGGSFIGELEVSGKSIALYQGDITNLTADVIVSSDDKFLSMRGGVSRKIRSVGGDKIYNQAQELVPLAIGDIGITTAGKLSAKKIYHGAVMDLYQKPSPEILKQVVRKCLVAADRDGFQSIAFPLLGTGTGCFPALEALQIILEESIQKLGDYSADLNKIILVIYSKISSMNPTRSLLVGLIQSVLETMTDYHFSTRAQVESRKPITSPQIAPNDPTIISAENQLNPVFPQIPPLSTFNFEVVTVDRQGEIIQYQDCKAQSFQEDLGDRIAIEMVSIPGGTFLMGSPDYEQGRDWDESPQHEVNIAPFYLSKFQMTQAQWRRVAALPQVNISLESHPSHFQGDNLPVEQVSWYEVEEFCARLSRHTGRNYRLPSEAQWEYAARAGTITPFYCGATLTTELANFNSNFRYANAPKGENREKTTPVGSFPPNPFGLYDIHGNVWEWCLDSWHDNYDRAPNDGSAWLSENDTTKRVLRGGSWMFLSRTCRCADRDRFNPDASFKFVGFRLCLQ